MNKVPAFIFETMESRRLLSTTPWGVYPQMIGLDQVVAKYPQLNGTGQVIAEIDSGVDYNAPELGGGWGNKVIGGYDFQSGSRRPFSKTDGHGTATAGVMVAGQWTYDGALQQGIVPDAKLIAFREQSGEQIKQCLDWIIKHQAELNIWQINLTNRWGDAQAYASELVTLTKMGVFIAQPAGNGGVAQRAPKDTLENAFAIGGVNTTGNIATDSARGDLALVAPCDDVPVLWYDPTSGQEEYLQSDGTSWAVAAVTASAAMLHQINPAWKPIDIMNILQASSVRVYDSATGNTYDRLDLYQAVQLAIQIEQHHGHRAHAAALRSVADESAE